MKPEMTLIYEAPIVEIIEVEVERGFATSTGDLPGFTYEEGGFNNNL